MGTGWNSGNEVMPVPSNYNRLGYGYWLELAQAIRHANLYYNRLGYGYWLEQWEDSCVQVDNYNRLGYGYWLELGRL